MRSEGAREGFTAVVLEPQAEQVLAHDFLEQLVRIRESLVPGNNCICIEEFGVD